MSARRRRAGRRDRLRADRRRRARNADGAHQGVFHGSTDSCREGFGSYSSRSIVMGGSAIVAAAEKLRDSDPRGGREALRLRRRRTSTSSTTGGRARPDRRVDAGGACRASPSTAPTPATSAPTATARMPRMSRSMPKTGQVEVLDYVAVEDVGRIINPETLHGQMRRRDRAGPRRRAARASRL